MIKSIDLLKQNLKASVQAKKLFLQQEEQLKIFDQAVNEVVDCYQQGGQLYIAGNGGSAADAQHLAAEFVSKLAHDRAPLPAEALTVDTSILTAIGNDYGYENIFARQIAGKAKPEDIFLGITTSGNSENIIQALRQCRKQNIRSIIFTGNQGGNAKEISDYCIIASGEKTSTIQELHIVLAHTLCECVEIALFN